jgi:hypothetical protein
LKHSIFTSSFIGGAIGAIVIMIGLIVLDKFALLKTIDMLSFALVIAGLIITALTLLGGFTIVNTWNDIDTRTRTIVEKYQRDAKEEIERDSADFPAKNRKSQRQQNIIRDFY